MQRVSEKPGAIATDDDAASDSATIVLLDVAGNNRLAAEIEKREDIAAALKELREPLRQMGDLRGQLFGFLPRPAFGHHAIGKSEG